MGYTTSSLPSLRVFSEMGGTFLYTVPVQAYNIWATLFFSMFKYVLGTFFVQLC